MICCGGCWIIKGPETSTGEVTSTVLCMAFLAWDSLKRFSRSNSDTVLGFCLCPWAGEAPCAALAQLSEADLLTALLGMSPWEFL